MFCLGALGIAGITILLLLPCSISIHELDQSRQGGANQKQPRLYIHIKAEVNS